MRLEKKSCQVYMYSKILSDNNLRQCRYIKSQQNDQAYAFALPLLSIYLVTEHFHKDMEFHK